MMGWGHRGILKAYVCILTSYETVLRRPDNIDFVGFRYVQDGRYTFFVQGLSGQCHFARQPSGSNRPQT